MPPVADESSPELLQNRPEARAFKVEDLLGEVKSGRVRVPRFQRGFKWERDDALKLLDSIYRGFPVGTLLLWQTKADADKFEFGSVSFDAPARPDAWWVVDGQQRIVSMVRALLASEDDKDAFALYFDLDEGEFVVPPKPKELVADPARWLPLTEVIDSEHLFKWAVLHTSTAERRNRAFQLGKRIREYDIPAYIVSTGSEPLLREIFNRSNKSGRPLEASDVFDALHGAWSSQRPATYSQIADELASLGFGRVETKILHRLLRVLIGQDVTDRSGKGGLRLSVEDAADAYAKTARVARQVVQFLKNDVGIAHYELLPYKQPMVTLGKFFLLHPAPLPRSRALLVRWLWRGALNGSHRGDTVSTRRVLGQIDATSEETSVQRMLEQVSAQPSEVPDARAPFNFRHAAGKLQALALIDFKPRDLGSADELPIPDLFDRAQAGADIPLPQIIASLDGDAQGLLHSAANRLVHPSRAGLRRSLATDLPPGVAASHAIDEAALTALAQPDSLAFLERRAETLQQHFSQFFERQARWSETDRPSLRSLTVVDEDR